MNTFMNTVELDKSIENSILLEDIIIEICEKFICSSNFSKEEFDIISNMSLLSLEVSDKRFLLDRLDEILEKVIIENHNKELFKHILEYENTYKLSKISEYVASDSQYKDYEQLDLIYNIIYLYIKSMIIKDFDYEA